MSEGWIKVYEDKDELDDWEIIRVEEVVSMFYNVEHGYWMVWTKFFDDPGHWIRTDGIVKMNPFEFEV